MKEKVYIDSTIPSYYFDERESLKTFSEITRRWWKEESTKYELFVSDFVFQELREGDYPNKSKIIGLVKDIKILDYVSELDQITRYYVSNYVMPSSLIGDAVHLTYASYYKMDYLLTWNCNHLANAHKRRHIQVVNGILGLNTPQIITPMVLFEEN